MCHPVPLDNEEEWSETKACRKNWRLESPVNSKSLWVKDFQYCIQILNMKSSEMQKSYKFTYMEMKWSFFIDRG